MAHVTHTFEVSAAIKSSADKFYNFFKYDMNKLVTIFPASFTSVQLIEGKEGKVGCAKLWNYIILGITLTAKVKTEAIDDEGKSITFAAVEGDVMELYKSYKLTLTVTDGLAKWSFAFEMLTPLTPMPEHNALVAIKALSLVDAYLLNEN